MAAAHAFNNPRHGELLALIERRSELDQQIQAARLVLTQNRIDMHGPLVDAEGYPRNDIDVRAVRIARHAIICLENDYKDLMDQIEKGLNSLHEDARNARAEVQNNRDEAIHPLPIIAPVQNPNERNEALQNGIEGPQLIASRFRPRLVAEVRRASRPVNGHLENEEADGHANIQRPGPINVEVNGHMNGHSNRPMNGHASARLFTERNPSRDRAISELEHRAAELQMRQAQDVEMSDDLVPFAMVNFVNTGSPADEAGLLANDEITAFGSITHQNFQEVTQIASVVSHSVNQHITVRVVRGADKEPLTLRLTPHSWAGRGLLGCSVVPMATDN